MVIRIDTQLNTFETDAAPVRSKATSRNQFGRHLKQWALTKVRGKEGGRVGGGVVIEMQRQLANC